MFIFDVFFRKREDERVKQLEKRVQDLETVVLEMSANFRKLASLSLRTGEELDNLANYIKRRESGVTLSVTPVKKSDDFYN